LKVRAAGKTVATWRGLEDMGHRKQMHAFAEAVLRDGPAPVSLFETLVSAKTVLAAAEAAAIGRPIVQDFSEYAALR
jgi:hypothetical protein